jgi:chloramphenicol O-acetyltransferase type A
MIIDDKYQPRLLDGEVKEGYLNWSLNFFTDPGAIQSPYVDITIQLNVTDAYKFYKLDITEGETFFCFLIWNLIQTLKNHFYFNLRFIQNQWFILENPPVVVPVAVGGKQRFCEILLESASQIGYREFVTQYRYKLNEARSGRGKKVKSEDFLLSCFLGNLPNLQFTGLTLHWRHSEIVGQPYFYFGKRYWQNDTLFIPFSAKLNYACNDPFVLDLLIQDFNKRFVNNTDI